jgi:hypothetical protein
MGALFKDKLADSRNITFSLSSLDETERLMQSAYKRSKCSQSVLSSRWKMATEGST